MGHDIHFSFNIDNIIPHADERTSQSIIDIWQEAAEVLTTCTLPCIHPGNGKLVDLNVKADFSAILKRLQTARTESGSFDAWRRLHLQNSATPVDASLPLSLNCNTTALSFGDAFALGCVFQQQLYLTLNLALPGACQMLGVSFRGEEAHLYEAQSFDSKVFYDARMSSHQQNWPTLASLSIEQVWHWLGQTGLSRTDIALSAINKVLFTLLKLGRQSHRYGSRSALLVIQQIELLLGQTDLLGQEETARLRERCKLVLGDIPEAADCFIALFQLRTDLLQGQHPVRRPPLVGHTLSEENRELVAAHNSAIELGASMIIGLLQNLIIKDKQQFVFREVLL